MNGPTVIGRLTAALMLLVSLAIPAAAVAAPYAPPASNRASTPLSGTWRFLKADTIGAETSGFNDAAWPVVSVPHTWNNLDGQDGPTNGYYRSVGWYRRHVSLPSTYTGRRLFLQFDGSSLVTEVWVNGINVGRHDGGFTTFRFDVTAAVDTSAGNDNVIAVKVDNSNTTGIAPLAGDFTVFGGIYRDVSLIATDPLSAEMLDYGSSGVYLTQTNVSPASAELEVKTLVYNANVSPKTFALKTVVVDAAANIVGTYITRATLAAHSGGPFVQHATIANPHLWNGRTDPYLYSVYVEVHEGDETGPVRDVAPPQPLGFRWFSVDPDDGFFLNGHYLDLHGVNRHQDRLNKGWAISQADHDQDMKLIEEIGATAVRLAHYPQAQYFYSLADKNGMIVWAELPIVNGIGGPNFSINAGQQLLELIRQNYNHPAIVFWSLANEVKIDLWRPDPTALLTELNALAKQEDPYRITTIAACCVSDTDPTNAIPDTVAYNRYFGWYTGSLPDFGPWADATHSASPNRPIAVSEYGAGASIFLHAENPGSSIVLHHEEYQSKFHEAHWLQMKTRPFIWGKFVWNMFDFASDSRTEGDQYGRNDKGLVTYDRATRKDAFFWYKANWTTAPMVYVTSRRWTQRTVATTDVKVYSNTPSVELLLNGASLGTRSAEPGADHMFIWRNVVLNGGVNAVQAIASTGTSTVTDSVSWTLNGILPDTQPPTIFTAASASPAVVSATSTTLGVMGADDGGEPALTYTWSTVGTPPAAVTFSVNGTNAAKNTVASFTSAGSYALRVTVQDAGGRTVTGSVTVAVSQTLTAIQVSPATAVVSTGTTQQFTARAVDQFGRPLNAQPAVTWSASGGGVVSTLGVFTAGSTPGSGFRVSATASGRSGSATVAVVSTAGFSAAINFQPAGSPEAPGYLVDDGSAFGARVSGLSYGWNRDATDGARDRDNALSPDQRYDTLIHMADRTWEIAVPNGVYTVHAVVGDPNFFDVNAGLTIEGVTAVEGLTGSASPWLEGTVTVTVSDGRLTVGSAVGSYNKICFLELVSASVPVNQAPAVAITSPLNGATFTVGTPVAVVASATDADGSVTKVEFFDGATKLGEDTSGTNGWTLTWPNPATGAHVLTARATDNRGATTTSAVVAITVNTPPAPAVIRLDVGSTVAFTDATGAIWQPDQYGSGGTLSYKANPVDNTVDDDLYRTYRYGNFTYAIPIANGTYDVTLKCMETWWSLPGQRIFTVAAEGLPKLVGLDLFTLAGRFTAVERTFTVTVTDGVLNLAFSALIDNATVSAISIAPRP